MVVAHHARNCSPSYCFRQLFNSYVFSRHLRQLLIFLVVASPCALMAAIMPTLLSGIARGAKVGILFKNGSQIEKIGKIKAIARF